jgi:hypothetical protein
VTLIHPSAGRAILRR